MSEREVPQVLSLEQMTFAEPWSERDLTKAAVDSLYYYAVCMDGERMCGYAGMLFSYEEGQITNVAVMPDMRHHGIGKMLVKELIRIASEHGMKTVTLEVRESNLTAIHLYETCGFQSLGIRPNFYRFPDEGAVIMERTTD